jgi:hypothetical protein
MDWYQQGDVMIKPVEAIPADGTRVGEAVLAEGEATGHRHVAVGDGVAVLEREGILYLNAPSGARMTHAEHKEIEIPPGQYEIGIVREYDHFQDLSRGQPQFAPSPAKTVVEPVRRVRD